MTTNNEDKGELKPSKDCKFLVKGVRFDSKRKCNVEVTVNTPPNDSTVVVKPHGIKRAYACKLSRMVELVVKESSNQSKK